MSSRLLCASIALLFVVTWAGPHRAFAQELPDAEVQDSSSVPGVKAAKQLDCPSDIIENQELNWTGSVTNNGDQAVNDVEIFYDADPDDPVALDLLESTISIEKGDFTSSDGDNTVTYNIPTLDPGETVNYSHDYEAVNEALSDKDGAATLTKVFQGSEDVCNIDVHERGTIVVTKYEDLNANGERDSGDPSLSGWDITVEGTAVTGDDVGPTTGTTGSDGVTFANWPPGSYSVTEAVPLGWTKSYPTGAHSLDLASAQSAELMFLNWEIAQITGVKYEDLNGNGQRDEGEPGLEGWTIELDNGSTATTGSDGGFSFPDLVPDDYRVTEVTKEGWTQSEGTYSVTLESGDVREGLNFGNYEAPGLSGVKYEDLNGNGQRDEGEPGLEGWTIELDNGETATTGPDGGYSFSDLEPGEYTVSEVTQSGWVQSAPEGGTHSVALESGDLREGLNFGNYEKAGLSGVKYEDLNGNGQRDEGEPGLEGWTIELDNGETVTTGSDGSYSFTDLDPGEYTVTEVTQSGWTQSEGGHTVTLESGDMREGLNFGNVDKSKDFNTGENLPGAGTGGDPVSTFTGELFFTEDADLALGGPLPVRFQRYYASFLERDGRLESSLGPNWTHTFHWRLLELNDQVVEVVSWRGRVIRFENEGGTWTQTTLPERPYSLKQESGGYRLANPRSQLIYTFDAEGLLTRIEDGRGNELALTYDSEGRLSDVSDGLGRSLAFTYNGDRLGSVSDGSRSVQFGYTGGLLASATDPLGNGTNYSYDGTSSFTGLLTETTQPGGNTVLSQTFDAEGRVETQTDAFGNTTTFEYSTDEDTGEQTTVVTDPMGNQTEHVHDSEGRLLSATDANGETIELGYSDGGQRNRITDRLGDDTQYVFDSASRLPTSITDARGGVTSLNYVTRSDEGFDFQDLTGVSRPDGTSIDYSYDADGNVTSVTGPAGETWTLTYNNRGQPLTVTNPEGGTTTYTYNADGTLASVEDPAGNTTTYSYDALRRPVSITRPDGMSRTFNYDDADRLTSMTDEEGRTYNFSYDANGNLTSVSDPAGATIQRSYDAMDRLTSVTDRQGQSITYSYDGHGRLQSVTDRAGNTTTYGYGAEDRLTSITNGAGETSTIRYDAEGVPTALTNPEGETTTLTSNAMGWITQITSPLGNSMRRSYDAMGRVTSVQDPSGGTTQLTRDARGLLVGMTLPGGASASYDRDGLGLLEGRTGPEGGSWDAPRDALGRITGRTDPLGRSSSRTYDNRNRVESIQQPGNLGTVTRSYDGSNRLTRLSHSGGPSLSYSYDTNGRLTGATGVSLSRDTEGRITESNGLSVTRDAEGRIASVSLPGGTVQYRYDGADRLTEVEDWQGGVTSFSYDNAGRLTQITRPNGTVTSYGYDEDGRLVEIEETDGEGTVLASSSLTRDARGNVTEAERTGPVEPKLSPDSESRSYDAAGQVEDFSYDALGRRTDDGTRTYTWNGLSRLESYSDGSETTTFTYDAFGNRLTKETGGTTREYVWNYAFGLPSVSVVKEDGTDQRYYVHAPNGMLLYSVGAVDGSRRFYHFDEMGNTTLLTGEEGAVEGAFAYGPYGTVAAEKGDVETPFTWQGEFGVMAEGNGLYYMRARYYDASTRRFMSRDPVRSLRPDAINPYQYAGANPRRFADPTGLQWYGSFWQDGIAPGQYTFVSINNTGSQDQQVTLSFYDAEGTKSNPLDLNPAAGASWRVQSETMGGLAGTASNDGYLTITSGETVSNLQPFSTVVIPNEGNLPGFPANWDLKSAVTESSGDREKAPEVINDPGVEYSDDNSAILRWTTTRPPSSQRDAPAEKWDVGHFPTLDPEPIEATEYPVTVSLNNNEVAVGTVIVEERSTSGISVHAAPSRGGQAGGAMAEIRDLLPLSRRQAHWKKLPEIFLERPR